MSTATTPPNVVVFVSHDTGRFIGPHGIDTVRTPNADRLAAEGVLFEDAFCTAPQCSPSRASIFTGLYPHNTGVMGLTHVPGGWDLHDAEIHLARRLQQRGYETFGIGHMHETRDVRRLQFDAHVSDNRAANVAGHARELLQQRADPRRPFFLEIATSETHRPFVRSGPGPDLSRDVTVPPYLHAGEGTRREFAEQQMSVECWDRALGEVMQLLDEQGLADNTLLISTTDHGLDMPRAKCTLYDAGLEVYLMMRWPGRISAGVRRRGLVSNVDVMPTVLEAVGAPVPEHLHGRSLWPLIRDGSVTHRDRIFAEMTFHTHYDPMRAVRTSRYKYIRNFDDASGVMMTASVLDGPAFPENREVMRTPVRHPPQELYDLEQDPHELNNLAEAPSYEAVRAELATVLARWMHDTDDPLLRGPVPSPFYQQVIAAVRADAARAEATRDAAVR